MISPEHSPRSCLDVAKDWPHLTFNDVFPVVGFGAFLLVVWYRHVLRYQFDQGSRRISRLRHTALGSRAQLGARIGWVMVILACGEMAAVLVWGAVAVREVVRPGFVWLHVALTFPLLAMLCAALRKQQDPPVDMTH